MKRLFLSNLVMLVSIPTSAMDFESIDCGKYLAALAQGDPRSSVFSIQSRSGTPLDDAATAQFNFNKAKWAERRAELVADDIAELAHVVSTTIPDYQKRLKDLRKQIRKALNKEKPDLSSAAYLERQISKMWRKDLTDTLAPPYGYKDHRHFLRYNTGAELPSIKVATFYGGKIGQQLKALADYHRIFHAELNDKHPYLKWENMSDGSLLAVQKTAIQKYDRLNQQYQFDKSGTSSLLDKPASHPDREHAKAILKLAEAMLEDETVPLAHQAMLKDHLAYLQRYRLDPGALFIDYVETLRTRPIQPTETD